MKNFPCRQHELEAKIAEWQKINPEILRIDYVTSYSGDKVYGITVSDFSLPPKGKRAHYFGQPHAHEPGTTAGIIDLIEQLVTGKDLFGEPSVLNIQDVLSQTILSFCANGNPYGRERAPVDCWDGTYCDNERFWCWMRGEDPDHPGRMWKRLGIWDAREIKAANPVGIVYEPIGEFQFVEPNRSQESSYFKLFHRLDKVYHYEAWFDLHQCEDFSQADYNCCILLCSKSFCNPLKEPDNSTWARQVIAAWAGHPGLNPDPDPVPLRYTGEQLEYFRTNWAPLHQRMNIINSEVKNNSPEMTPKLQLKAQSLAIAVSIKRLLKSAHQQPSINHPST